MKISGVFLCAAFIAIWPQSGLAECGFQAGELVQVARVSDGDTLKLKDGRAVRVLGINAPEIAHGNSAGQPFGREARAAAQAFVDRSQGRVHLGFERERQDHYGRLLAHVYDSSGRSLAAAQLRAGMAMQIAVPPNIAQAQCLAAIEPDARKAQLGIWRDRYWQPLPSKAMRGAEVGFRLVSGRVAKVDINSAVWLELEGKLVLKVAKRDWQAFGYSKQDWLDFKGRKLEVRGWVSAQQSRRSQQFKPLVMQLRSPAAVSVIAD